LLRVVVAVLLLLLVTVAAVEAVLVEHFKELHLHQ
jgi:hypothetical protein